MPSRRAAVNILVVDDAPAKLLALRRVLDDLDQNVVTARSGRRGAARCSCSSEFAVDPARRQHARDGRLRDGGADPPAARAPSTRRSSSSRPTATTRTRRAAIRSGRSTTSSRRSCPRSCAPRSRCSSSSTGRRRRSRRQAEALEQRAAQLQRLTRGLARDQLGALARPDARRSSPTSRATSSAPTRPSPSRRRNRSGRRRERRRAVAGRTTRRGRAAALCGPRSARLAALGDPPDASARAARSRDLGARTGARPASGRPSPGADGSRRRYGRDGRRHGPAPRARQAATATSREDDGVLTQLAQMSSIAIENTLNAEAREANRMKDEFLGDALARAAHAAHRHPRLARCSAPRRAGPRADRARPRSHRAQRARAGAAHRGPARRLAHHHRQAAARRPAGRPARAVIEAALDSMRPAADAKEIEIALRRADSERRDDLGDPDRLQQVVWNLLSNAIKFTPRGGRVDVEPLEQRLARRDRASATRAGHRRPSSCRTSSTLPPGRAARRRARTAAWGSASRSCATSSELHGGTVARRERRRRERVGFRVNLPLAVVFGIERARAADADVPAADRARQPFQSGHSRGR